MLQKKLTNLQKMIRAQGLDSLLVGNFGHQVADDLLYYLLLKKLESGILLVPAREKPTLYAISFEVVQLQKAYPELLVKPLDRKITDIISLHATKRSAIGIRSNVLPTSIYTELQNYRITELENAHTLFAAKLPEEVKIMQRAAKITGDVFELALNNWKTFTTETDAAHFINERFVALGYEPSFPTIVAAGKNAAHPHHVPTYTKLQPGFCVIDMGVRYQGYCSDMTRTIFIGKPTTDERELYESVLFAQEKTISMVKAGVPAAGLDDYCRDLLGDELSSEFIHGLGHGVGTQVHEWPSVSGKSTTMLQENMVITIEPGVYKQGAYGIRIEDDILVTRTKPIVLTRTSKQLRIIPR